MRKTIFIFIEEKGFLFDNNKTYCDSQLRKEMT